MNWGNCKDKHLTAVAKKRKTYHLHIPTFLYYSWVYILWCWSTALGPYVWILMLCCYPCKHAVLFAFLLFCVERSYNKHQSNSNKVHTMNSEFKQRLLQYIYQLLSLLGLLKYTTCFIKTNEIFSSHFYSCITGL